MFRSIKRKLNNPLPRTAFLIAVFGFILCSNHLIPDHHNSNSLKPSSELSQESPSKELNECTDTGMYSIGGRNCITEDITFAYNGVTFTEDFIIKNLTLYFFKDNALVSYKTTSLYILHSILQV